MQKLLYLLPVLCFLACQKQETKLDNLKPLIPLQISFTPKHQYNKVSWDSIQINDVVYEKSVAPIFIFNYDSSGNKYFIYSTVYDLEPATFNFNFRDKKCEPNTAIIFHNYTPSLNEYFIELDFEAWICMIQQDKEVQFLIQ